MTASGAAHALLHVAAARCSMAVCDGIYALLAGVTKRLKGLS